MGKEIGRKVLEGTIMPKVHKAEGATRGLPASGKGKSDDNKGKSIRDFRVGRGAV